MKTQIELKRLGIVLVLMQLVLFSCYEKKVTTQQAREYGKQLPFPIPPSKSEANQTLAESKLAPWPNEKHLSEDAPNVLIVLIDDCWFWDIRNIRGRSSYTNPK